MLSMDNLFDLHPADEEELFGLIGAVEGDPDLSSDDEDEGDLKKKEEPVSVTEAKAEKRAIKHSGGLWKTVTLMSFMGTLINFSLVTYLVIVFLNLTFTFEPRFTQTMVPFYTNPITDANFRVSDRYDEWWWLVAIGALRIISINGSFSAMTLSAFTGSTGWLSAMMAWLIGYGIVDFLISIYYLLTFLFRPRCADSPPCRSWDAEPADSAETAGVANWVFVLLMTYSLVFVVVHVIYASIINTAIKTLTKKSKERKRKAANI